MIKQRFRDEPVTPAMLDARVKRASNYPKAKWIEFCETVLGFGLEMTIYEARETVSKYITIYGGGDWYVVRFSNHKPNRQREKSGDCDFFVGVNHGFVSNSTQALAAVREYFFEEPPTIPMPRKYTRRKTTGDNHDSGDSVSG